MWAQVHSANSFHKLELQLHKLTETELCTHTHCSVCVCYCLDVFLYFFYMEADYLGWECYLVAIYKSNFRGQILFTLISYIFH